VQKSDSPRSPDYKTLAISFSKLSFSYRSESVLLGILSLLLSPTIMLSGLDLFLWKNWAFWYCAHSHLFNPKWRWGLYSYLCPRWKGFIFGVTLNVFTNVRYTKAGNTRRSTGAYINFITKKCTWLNLYDYLQKLKISYNTITVKTWTCFGDFISPFSEEEGGGS
jgi:hypothetical protein